MITAMNEPGNAPTAFAGRDDLAACAMVPLAGSQGVLGAISLASDRPHYYDDTGTTLLVTLGRQIATGLERVTLYRETVAQAAELAEHREQLENLVERRTQQLSTANSELAEEIAERRRTEQELNQTLAQLNASRMAALNMMQDADLARHRTEQANRDLHDEITERLRVEAELEKQTADLARSNQELEHFAYVASHDLQEPLRSISGYLQLLQRRYSGALDERADMYIGRSVAAVQRMRDLIEALLTFSRVGTRGQPFVPTNCNLVLGEVLADSRIAIEESNAWITNDLLPTLTADPGQIGQLLMNLVGNSIKFRDPQRTPEIHIGAERQDDEWLFSVRDNGIGIDLAYTDRIFVIFQRLHTRDEYPGTRHRAGDLQKDCGAARRPDMGRGGTQPGVGLFLYPARPAGRTRKQRTATRIE